MKIKNYLDVIDLRFFKIIRLFASSKRGYTGRQISELTGINLRTCLRYLNKLCNKDILVSQAVGKAYSYTIINNYFTSKILLPLIKEEENLWEQMKRDISKKFSQYCKAIIVFGSYATGQETDTSDLDICFIVNKKTKDFETMLNMFNSKTESDFGLIVSPYILSLKELKEKKKLTVIKEIRNEGIWIHGEKEEVPELW